MHFASEPTVVVAVIEVLIGVLLLARSADEFVDGASRVAARTNVSPVLVGAVIVGFGTSVPELLVSSLAANGGDVDLGIGNIVGSNVANLSLVLGAAALLIPVLVTRSVLVREAPLSLLAVMLFAFLAYSGGLTQTDGVVLAIALLFSVAWIIVGGRHGQADPSQAFEDGGTMAAEALRTAVGLAGTVAGAQLLVWGAVAIADTFNMSGGFVGFTLVAIGTSLPELMTAIAAARRGATDLLLGNLLGSNIFNSLGVGAAIALIGPGPMNDDGLRTVGLFVMVVVALGAWVAMVTLKRVHRWEGSILLVAWLVAVLLLARTGTDAAMADLLPF